MTVEAQIHADIEALRVQVPETQALYREVCTVLFFRYGITPTANKLYQYVRKGSMSAPAEALAKFWEELREKSRVRIEHPDLPEAVKSAAGDLVASLWSQAQAAAREGLDAFRVEARAAVLAAQTEKAAAAQRLADVMEELDLASQAAEATANRILTLERELAVERAAKEALATHLDAAARKHAAVEAALAEARQDFAAELEKLRHTLQRSEQRCEATEKRALLEIDRQRTAAARSQKEVGQLRQAHQQANEHHQARVAQLQRELSESGQKLGVAEGKLLELRAANQRQGEQLETLRGAAAEADTLKALLQRDLETSQNQLAALAAELQILRATATTGVDQKGSRRASGIKRKPRKSEVSTAEQQALTDERRTPTRQDHINDT